MKKNIKIAFVDFASDFDIRNNEFSTLLSERYNVIIDDVSPDYLFYSNFGREYLKYDCVKIFYTGECIVPDFNLCDYAIAFDNLTFGDRYIRVPLYELFQYGQRYRTLLDNSYKRIKDKSAFCGFVVSNDQGMPEREEMFKLLSKYKKVDSGGRYKNNIGGAVKNKLEFDRQHKFSIVFENCAYPSYTTEKIVDAFVADTIPIYYGNPMIGKEFNTKSFINVHEFSSFENAVKRVIEIDNDPELYDSIKSEPKLTEARTNCEELKSFLYNIFDQEIECARRRPVNTRTAEKEEEQKIYDCYLRILGRKIKKIKSIIRRFKNKAL